MPGPEKTSDILIVEDQPEALENLERVLQEDGHRVLSASTRDKAIEMASRQSPDLMLVDMNMPDTDSLEVCRSLKANPRTEDILVMFLSNPADNSTKAQLFDVGAIDFVEKPYNVDELRARVKAHLRLKSRLDTLTRRFQELSDKLDRSFDTDTDRVDQSCVIRESKTIVFSTDISRVPAVINQLLIGIGDRLTRKLRNDLVLGIHEIVLNAIEHGNLEIDSEEKKEALDNQAYVKLLGSRLARPELSSRRVTIEYRFNGAKIHYTIGDEGKGFNWREFLKRVEPEDLLAASGRGILMSRYIFDSISYNDAGNVVYLEKRIS